AVAALLGRAAGRVALDDEQLAQRRVLLLAVGELAGQAGDVERALAPGQVAGLARGLARTRGVDDLAGDGPGFVRVLLQELLQARAEGVLDHGADLGAEQVLLGLAGEVRLGRLHGPAPDRARAQGVARQ